MSQKDSETDLLIAYVQQALQQQARGEPIRPTEICRAHPELAPALAEALGLADELDLLQRVASSTDPLHGLVLAHRYRLETSLGRGAMGIVYRATDQELGRPVAVKILDARLFHDEVAEQRFQREAELLASMQHPNTVAVYDRGRTPEGIHFLVMELLEGATLAAILDRIAGTDAELATLQEMGVTAHESHWPRQCAAWARDLARGLAAAHERGVVHRDVKPSNVFVTSGGSARLLDFGIATQSQSARLTATETTLGTPWYMAPEQVKAGGTRPLPAQDVYGLSATLYHLVTHTPPYSGDGPAVLAALASQDPAPLRRVRPDTPRDLAAIIEHGMQRDPAGRYPSADALARDLDAFLSHQPVVARPISGLGRWLRRARRAPARAAAVVSTALLAIAVLIGWPMYAKARERERAAELAVLRARVPPLIALECSPDERILAFLDQEHTGGIALLSEILTLDPDDLSARLFRGALYLDLGDRAAAAADFARIAVGDSPYLTALAQRYLQADGRGTEAIDVADLPRPDRAADHFVAGFHELRNRHVAGFADRALEHLELAKDEIPAARDLLLIAIGAKADTSPGGEKAQLWRRLRDEARELERIYGQRTARTQAMLGLALTGLQNYAEAVETLEESLRLRPGRHGPLQNLGVALRRLNRLDEAAERLDAAFAVHPFAWNTSYTLAQVARDRDDFAAAYEWAARVPKDARPDLDWKLPHLIGNIAIAEAVWCFAQDEPRAQAAAQRALEEFRRGLESASAAGSARVRANLERNAALAEALLARDAESACMDYMQLAFADPDDPYTIANLAHLLPAAGLSADATAVLGQWLRLLARRRAAGDEAFRQRMLDEANSIPTKPR